MGGIGGGKAVCIKYHAPVGAHVRGSCGTMCWGTPCCHTTPCPLMWACEELGYSWEAMRAESAGSDGQPTSERSAVEPKCHSEVYEWKASWVLWEGAPRAWGIGLS